MLGRTCKGWDTALASAVTERTDQAMDVRLRYTALSVWSVERTTRICAMLSLRKICSLFLLLPVIVWPALAAAKTEPTLASLNPNARGVFLAVISLKKAENAVDIVYSGISSVRLGIIASQ